MGKIDKLLSELEEEMTTKNMMPNHQWIFIIPIVAILVLFIIFTPWWAWMLFLISLAIVAYITKNNNVCKTDNRHLNYILTELRKEMSVGEKNIEDANNKIKELEEKLKKNDELREQEKLRTVDIDQLSQSPFVSLLNVLQSLDTETVDFGDDCHKYVSNQIAKSFRCCGLRFQDYSEEYADCYNIDIDSKITEIEYLRKAVMDNNTNKVVLKGKVFLPEK